MTELKALTCKNCGATINRATMKCEYCDTQYQRTYEGAEITFVSERAGVHSIRAMVAVDELMVGKNPEAATEFAVRKLRNSIADGLLEYMRCETEVDPIRFCRIIRGEVRVVDPSFGEYF